MINRREAKALRGRKNCVSSTVPKNLSIEGWSHVVSSTVLKCVWPEDRSRVPITRPMHCHVSGLHSRGQCPLHAPHTSPVTTVKTAQQGQGTVSTPRPTHLPSDHFEPCRGQCPLYAPHTSPVTILSHAGGSVHSTPHTPPQ